MRIKETVIRQEAWYIISPHYCSPIWYKGSSAKNPKQLSSELCKQNKLPRAMLSLSSVCPCKPPAKREAAHRKGTAHWFACTASFSYIIRAVSLGHKVFCHSKRRQLFHFHCGSKSWSKKRSQTGQCGKGTKHKNRKGDKGNNTNVIHTAICCRRESTCPKDSLTVSWK